MYAALGALAGILYSVMNLFNARLSQAYGNALALVLIHGVGLLCALPLFFRPGGREKGQAPWWMHLGGLVGIFVVVASNLGVSALGVTATLALTLLGQTLVSMVFDHFGLWGLKKTPFRKEGAASLALIALGTAVMLLW